MKTIQDHKDPSSTLDEDREGLTLLADTQCITCRTRPRPKCGRSECWTCIGRRRRNGDPEVVFIKRNPPGFVSYGLAHKRVKAARGRACDGVCVDCGAQGAEWSYAKTDPDQLISPQGYPYSLDVQQYVIRCVLHHRRQDARPRRPRNPTAEPRIAA